MVAAKMTKNIGKGVGEKDGKDSDEDGEKDEDDFDDSPSPCNFRPPLFSFTFSSF